MQIDAATILDIALVAVLIGTVFSASRRGFITTIIKLVGTTLSLCASYFVAGRLSTEVFERFFKGGLIRETTDVIAAGGQLTIQNMVDKLVPILPQALVEQLLGGADKLSQLLDVGTPDIALQVVDHVIAPLFLPIITVVVFFVTFAACSFVTRFLAAAFINFNKVPILGGANRLLGTVLGAALGALYLMLLLCAAWAFVIVTGDNLSWFNSATLEGSFFYRTLSAYNPFL